MSTPRSPRIDVLRSRLANHGLSRPPFAKPADVVRRLGAVQAQDWAAAQWSLGMRTRGGTRADISGAYDAGEILRTHVLRPTWHFVLPEDIRWMLALTAPQVRKAIAHYNRKMEIDGTLISRSNNAIAEALRGGNHLTRPEIGALLAALDIATNVQRLAHIVMEAELDGLICSGPLRGKQRTYALLEERVPPAEVISREDAIAKLCLRYFTGHGPAQLKDFAWWSGLSMEDARHAVEMNVSHLEETTAAGRTFRFVPLGRTPRPAAALLLSIYDEYTIAYKDRSDLGDARDVETMLSMGNALTAVIVLDGKVAGTWKRRLSHGRITVELRPFRRLTGPAREALEEQVVRLGDFLGLEAVAG